MKNMLLYLLIIGPVLLSAATVTWNGDGGNDDWNNADNWDTDMVPTAGDIVIINGSSADVVFSGTSTVERVLVESGGSLTIESGSELTIDGSDTDDGLETSPSGTIINHGDIIVINADGQDGIFSKGTFTNNGSISVDGVGQHGIYLQSGVFTNASGASISVTNVGLTSSSGDHIYADDSGGTPSTFNNEGTIDIVMVSGDDGVYANDGSTFNNSSILNISLGDGGDTDDSVSAEDFGVFHNQSGGVLTISSSGDIGMQTKNNGSMINDAGGTIIIDDIPDDQISIVENTSFTNSGTIMLDGGGDYGIHVDEEATFTNTSSGEIYISDANDYSISLDGDNSGSPATFDNSGLVSITDGNNDGLRIRNDAVMNNLSGGSLMFDNTGDEAIQVDDPGTLDNAGIISIIDAGDHGMELFGIFDNSGTISVDGTQDIGLNVLDDCQFTNMIGGRINISGTSNYGVQIDANSNSATISNSGRIRVFDGDDDGLRVRDGGTLENNSKGVFLLYSSGDEGIQIDNPGTIINEGGIGIKGSTDNGIEMVGGTFSNLDGSVLEIASTSDKGILMASGTVFNNSGIVVIEGVANEGTDMVGGIFNNMVGGVYSAVFCGDDGLEVNTAVFNNDGAIRIGGSGSEELETFSGASFNNSATATFAPGIPNYTGEFELKGDLDLGASTTIFQIRGTVPADEYDRLENFSGSTLTVSNATMRLNWGAYVPNIGDCFTVVSGSGAVSGTFNAITSTNPAISVDVSYSGTNVEVCVTNVNISLVAETILTEESRNVETNKQNHRQLALSELPHVQNTNSDKLISIYPNPAQEVLNYRGASASLTFYDIFGRPVLKQMTNGDMESIDISQLEVGSYWIEIISDTNEITFERLIKK